MLTRLSRQFPTRVLALMPVAIAINIVLGVTVQQALKLPIYLDSIGTILVGILAGPLAGMATGVLANLIWGYLLPPPIGTTTIGPFAITAGVIGLLAGVWGRLGLFRSRRPNPVRAIVGAVGVVVLVGGTAFYTYARAYASPEGFGAATGFDPAAIDQSRLFFLLVMGVFAALIAWALVLRRDAGVIYALGAGLVTGIVAAVVSAPIAALVYGGVTGGGTDVIVLAFRAAGDSLYAATLKQGLLSDPLDKMVTSFVVFAVITSLSARYVARFPLGDRLVEGAPGE
jgi:hypothetical protein